jgi:predicted porin
MEETMKKAWIVTSLATLALPLTSAYAQSSVTLYGRLDAGIEYMNGLQPTTPGGGGSRWRAESGDWGTSLWGLKGVEELGGGLQAVFRLEGAFNTMTGAGPGSNQIFDRFATVGLSSKQYGTFNMGRELAISNGVWDFDPFVQSNWSSASLVRGRNWQHTSNNISYQSPNYAGFDFAGQYSLSNATNWNGNGTTTQGRADGAQVTYTSSLFQVRGIYDELRDSGNGALDSAFTASREYTAALNLFLGQFKINAAYQAIRSSGGLYAAGQPTSLDHEWGGITWQATPAAALTAAVYHVNANKGSGNATMYALGGTYNLSKRTQLHLEAATVQNSSSANFSLNANAAGTSAASGNPLVGHSQTGVFAGIEHVF